MRRPSPATGAGLRRDSAAGGEEPRLLVGARFTASAAQWEQLPLPGLPEVAFAGRSNAGKSSAINTLTGRHRLAYVSKTPGRTQLANFFSVPAGIVLVDLPGYGFSRVGEDVRQRWQPLLERYFTRRESLVGVVLIMDCRHPLTPLDRQLIDWLLVAGRPVHALLAKSDKLSRSQGLRTLAEVRREMRVLDDEQRGLLSAQLFSSPRRAGVAEAEAKVGDWLLAARKTAP